MSTTGSDIDMATPASPTDLNVIIKSLQDKITALEKEAAEHQDLINEVHTKVDDVGKNKLKIEAPEKFDGKKEDLSRFLTEMSSYMEHYDARFPDEETKTRYVASRLTGQAARWFEPTLKDYIDHASAKQQVFTKTVFEDYDQFEKELRKVFGDQDERVHAQDRLARLRQTKSTSAYATLFRQDSIRAGINEEGLMQLFYDGLKDDVKDELYKEDRPATLDEYIAKAIRIDDRQYARKQQRKGQGRFVPGAQGSGGTANTGKKRQQKSTSYGTHAGPMDIDAAQAQWAGRKDGANDKSGITCYNCGKKGHFKRDCRSKKEWRPVPRKETATIDQAMVGKRVRIQEVATASYTQDDLEYDIDRANDQESALTDSDQAGLAEDDQHTGGPSNTLIETDDEGEVAPPRFALAMAGDWGLGLVQQDDGHWRVRQNAEENAGPNLAFLQNRVLELRERVYRLEDEKAELEKTLEERNDQYGRLRAKLNAIQEGVQELTNTHGAIGQHLDRITEEARILHEEQIGTTFDYTPWDGPTEPAEDHENGVRYPEKIYLFAQEERRSKGQTTQDWDEYWARNQYLGLGRSTKDLEIQGLRGVLDAFRLMEKDHQRLNPRKWDHVYLPWFQYVAHKYRYHFQSKLHYDHWPIRNRNQADQPLPTTWVYDHGSVLPALLWDVGATTNGRLRAKPKNAWPQTCRMFGEMRNCIEADCVIHADEKLREHAKQRKEVYQQRPNTRRRIEPWMRQWLQEHQTIDAASQGADRDASKHHESLGNGSGPSEGPGSL